MNNLGLHIFSKILFYYIVGNVEMICNNNDNTMSRDHNINGINTSVVNSETATSVNIGDIANNNESPKIGKKLKENDKKGVEEINKDTKINDISHSDDSSEENIENKKQDTEIIFIQDLGFNVKIICPGTEAFEIQVLLLSINDEIVLFRIMLN